MSKRYHITITELPPVEFNSPEELERHVITYRPEKPFQGDWSEAIKRFVPKPRRKRTKKS